MGRKYRYQLPTQPFAYFWFLVEKGSLELRGSFTSGILEQSNKNEFKKHNKPLMHSEYETQVTAPSEFASRFYISIKFTKL